MGREFTRQELYDLVWREPLRTLAKTLHISDVRLAKICRRANIPLPGLGYWAKRAYGKARPSPLTETDPFLLIRTDPASAQ